MKISAKEKKILVLLLLVIVAVVLFMYVLKPMMETASDMKIKLEELKSQDNQYSSQISGRDTLDNERIKEIGIANSNKALVPQDYNKFDMVQTVFPAIIQKIKDMDGKVTNEIVTLGDLNGGKETIITKVAEVKGEPNETLDLYYYEAKIKINCKGIDMVNLIIEQVQKDKFIKIDKADYDNFSVLNPNYDPQNPSIDEPRAFHTLNLTVRCYVKTMPLGVK